MLAHPRTFFATALAALVAFLAWFGLRERPVDPAAELARLVPGHRPLAARLALPAPHAPFAPGAAPAAPEEREVVYSRLVAARGSGDPGAAGALAAFYAFRNEPGDRDRALREASAPVDRAAVLLALERPAEAFEAVTAALARQPDDPAARFDRALILEALSLDGRAALAWEAFLEVEETGAWADEARERLALLRRPLPHAERPLDLQKRDAVERFLEARGPADLEPLRPVARRLAEAGDELLARELDYLETLDAGGWRRRDREVRRFLAAREQVLAGHDAGRPLRELEDSAEPLVAVKAVHFAAYGAILGGDRAGGAAALARLQETCRRVGCREELALVESDLGTLHQRVGDYRAAGRAYARAGERLPAGFEGRAAEIRKKQAGLAMSSGAPEEAERFLASIVRREREARAVHSLPSTLISWARAWRALGLDAVAEAGLREALDVARSGGDRGDEIRAVRSLAEVLAETGRVPEAVWLLEEAVDRLRGTELRLHLSLALAGLSRLRLDDGDAEGALAPAREAVALARVAGSNSLLANALELLALATGTGGDRGTAHRYLDEALRLDEERLARTPGVLPARRLATVIAPRRMRKARFLAEDGSLRAAYETFAGGSAEDLAPGECRIGFAAVDGQLLAFSLSAAGARYDRRPLAPGELRLLEGPVSPRADAVIGSPWSADRCPAGADRVVFLEPPGALDYPAVALARRERPEAVLGVTLAPGARWPEAPRRDTAVVLYGVADDDGLPSLPGGAAEADAVSRSWRRVERLRGVEATIEALAARAADADLLHFAVHGVAGDRTAASFLALAGSSGDLQVSDVLDLVLHRRRPLVVLSSCNTADTTENLEDDGAGLPWAFLAAGARAVVAHVGELGDDDAVRFSRAFYEALSSGVPVAEAVTAASRGIPLDSGGAFVLYFR